MNSLYAKYIDERGVVKIIENEKGFMTYYFSKKPNGESYCFVEDAFVLPEFRKSGVAKMFADEISVIAKNNEINLMYASVCMSAKNCIESINVLSAYGMKYSHFESDGMFFVKEL